MDQQHLVEILKKGHSEWNEWRKTCPLIAPDLSGAVLQEKDLSHCNLNRANLQHSNLIGSHFANADLSESDLTGANLAWTDMRLSNLSRSNLTRAKLKGTILRETNLSGAILNEARMGFTILGHTNLTNTRGLETIRHVAPSILGIDMYQTYGHVLPRQFLIGCGVSDALADYATSLSQNPIQLSSCFISYAKEDEEFALRLHEDLHQRSIQAWVFATDARWGQSVWGEIDEAIRCHERMILVCSKHSLVSGPVKREIERALQREDREGSLVIFPLNIDDFLLTSWNHPRKADITKIVVADFTDWRTPKKYDAALERLVSALRTH